MAKKVKRKTASGAQELLAKLRDSAGKSWLDKLTANERALMFAVRQAWKAGEITKGSMRVHEDIVGHLGDKAPSETTLRRFLGSKPARAT